MELTQYQVDAFAGKLFQGNPAAVVPLTQWLPDETMQAVAQENNLSETAFFLRDGQSFHLRWFTPVMEVDLCGHATLASAHVLFDHLGLKDRQITFQTRSGALKVERRGDWYIMDFPADPPVRVATMPEALKQAFKVDSVEVYKGREDYLIVFDTQEQIEGLRPELHHLHKLDGRGVIATAPGRDTDMASRCFFPKYGVDEDPVTGSAHTTLAPYWAGRLGRSELTAVQRSPRSGFLRLRLLDNRVEISGQAVTFMEGRIRL